MKEAERNHVEGEGMESPANPMRASWRRAKLGGPITSHSGSDHSVASLGCLLGTSRAQRVTSTPWEGWRSWG